MATRRIAVAATGEFGADVLERLAAEHDVVQLLTRPDKPRGRGRKLAAPPAKEVAERLGIPVAQPARLDGTVELGADTMVVCAYGLLIPNELLERALWLNVHPSLLPRWRGAAPVERAILAGDDETGVTIHRTVEALDAGPVAAQRAFAIEPDDDAGAVYARAAEIAAELLRDVLAQDEPRFEPQPEEGATYAEKIRPADRELDPDAPAQELVNRVRALSPHIGARLGDLIVWRAQVGEDGAFEPLEVQPAGGRRMAYDAYLRGRRWTWWHAVVESEHELMNPTSADKIRLLGERLGLGSDSRVLDIASGHSGPAIVLAREFGCRVTCVERAPEFLAAARDRIGGGGARGSDRARRGRRRDVRARPLRRRALPWRDVRVRRARPDARAAPRGGAAARGRGAVLAQRGRCRPSPSRTGTGGPTKRTGCRWRRPSSARSRPECASSRSSRPPRTTGTATSRSTGRRSTAGSRRIPGHPQAEEFRARGAARRARYLAWERAAMGWAIFVCRA